MGDVDLALRYVTTRHPEDLARIFLPADAPILEMRWLDTQVAARERRMDKGLLVRLPDYRLAIHNEWFITPDGDIPWRMYEYGYDILAALRQEDAALAEAAKERAKTEPAAPPYTPPPRVYLRSCAVLLDGPEGPLPEHDAFALTPPDLPPGQPVGQAPYRIEPVYQRTTAELVARAGLLWLVFAPLARDASEENVRRAVQAAKQRAQSRDELQDIASAMQVLAVARPRTPTLSARIIAMFQEEGLIERSPFYQMGLEKGIERGRLEGIEKGLEQGRREALEGAEKALEKGHLDGAHALQHALLTALAVRKLKLTPAQKARITATTDLATLERWTCAALTAKTATAVFDDKPAAKSARKKR